MSMLKFLVWLLCLFSFQTASSEFGSIGVNYGRIANNLPDPSKVVERLKSNAITRVKIFDADPSVLSALAESGINVTVAMPDQLLSSAAADISSTDAWLKSNTVPFHPRTMIEAIAVGNEVFMDSQNTPFLVPTMENMHASLQKLEFSSDIKHATLRAAAYIFLWLKLESNQFESIRSSRWDQSPHYIPQNSQE